MMRCINSYLLLALCAFRALASKNEARAFASRGSQFQPKPTAQNGWNFDSRSQQSAVFAQPFSNGQSQFSEPSSGQTDSTFGQFTQQLSSSFGGQNQQQNFGQQLPSAANQFGQQFSSQSNQFDQQQQQQQQQFLNQFAQQQLSTQPQTQQEIDDERFSSQIQARTFEQGELGKLVLTGNAQNWQTSGNLTGQGSFGQNSGFNQGQSVLPAKSNSGQGNSGPTSDASLRKFTLPDGTVLSLSEAQSLIYDGESSYTHKQSGKSVRKQFIGLVRQIFTPCDAASVPCVNPTYNPVCDSWGRTHKNLCEFERAQCRANQLGSSIAIAANGPCVGLPVIGAITIAPNLVEYAFPYYNTAFTTGCERACGQEYIPVCDNEGRSYQNDCFFTIAECYANRAGRGLLRVACGNVLGALTSTFVGTLIEPAIGPITQPLIQAPLRTLLGTPTNACFRYCDTGYRPVCDQFGTTHQNECELSIKQCLANIQGRESPIAVTNTACTVGRIVNTINPFPSPVGQLVLPSTNIFNGGSLLPPPVASPILQPLINPAGFISRPNGVTVVNGINGCYRTMAFARGLLLRPDCARQLDRCSRGGAFSLRQVCGTDGCTYENRCVLEALVCQESIPGVGSFTNLAADCNRPCPCGGNFYRG